MKFCNKDIFATHLAYKFKIPQSTTPAFEIHHFNCTLFISKHKFLVIIFKTDYRFCLTDRKFSIVFKNFIPVWKKKRNREKLVKLQSCIENLWQLVVLKFIAATDILSALPCNNKKKLIFEYFSFSLVVANKYRLCARSIFLVSLRFNSYTNLKLIRLQ